MGPLETALFSCDRAGECAFFHPEQRRFEDPFGKHRAVERDERAFVPRRKLVNCPSRKLLSSTRLANQQYRGGGGRGLLERIHHRSKRGRLADHHPPARSAKIRKARLEVPVFCDQSLLFESLLNALDQRVPLERLGDEIIG